MNRLRRNEMVDRQSAFLFSFALVSDDFLMNFCDCEALKPSQHCSDYGGNFFLQSSKTDNRKQETSLITSTHPNKKSTKFRRRHNHR